MSERSTMAETETVVSTVAREERRKIRRVGVNMQVKIRTADADDGDFEEIRTTQNASRKAVYFFTPLIGYYKGMKLKVTFPYDTQASANLEQTGEVVRVHRRGTGFGVAVALKAESEAPAKPVIHGQDPLLVTAPQKDTPSEERRCAKRTAFIAPVELIDVRSGSRIKARIADLSLHGCYVDTLNPLPVGSAVRLQIQKVDETFDVLAKVTSQHPGSGMGLEFSDIAAEQRAMLRSWLADRGNATQAGLRSPRSSNGTKHSEDVDQVYAIRLINALVRKGVLSKSEATELMRDPEE
jgi:PilZ domain